MEFINQLNEFYKILDNKGTQIKDILSQCGFDVKMGYFNGHYVDKDCSGNYVKDYYPIPVIEVKGLCDIEIGNSFVGISSKLAINDALNFDYGKLSDYQYEVYGVIDYLGDYYKSGEDVGKLYRNLKKSNETEIGFAFSFESSATAEIILKAVNFLKNNGFYY